MLLYDYSLHVMLTENYMNKIVIVLTSEEEGVILASFGMESVVPIKLAESCRSIR